MIIGIPPLGRDFLYLFTTQAKTILTEQVLAEAVQFFCHRKLAFRQIAYR